MHDRSFRILAFSDWRSQDLRLPEAVLDEIGGVDLIVYAGDDVRRVALTPDDPEADVRRAVHAVAAFVGGASRAQPWTWRPSDEAACGIGVVFWEGVEVPAPPLRGRPARAADGALAFITDLDFLRALRKDESKVRWAYGWEFETRDERQNDVADASIVTALEAAAAPWEWDLPVGPVIVLGHLEPSDSVSVVREMLKVDLPPNRLSALATRSRFGVAAVLGNDCDPADGSLLTVPGVNNVDAEPLIVDGWGVLGLAGAPGDIGTMLYLEPRAADHLRQQRARLPSDLRGIVVVSHAPPAGTLDLAARFGVGHIGSSSLRSFCTTGADLVICGHVHRQGGRTAQSGRATVVNVANHDDRAAPGRFALIRLAEGSPPAVSWLDPDPVGLQGIGSGRARKLHREGIHTLTSLADALGSSALQPALRRALSGIGSNGRRRLELHVEALRTRSFVRDPEAPAPNEIKAPVLFVNCGTSTPGADGTAPPIWYVGFLDPASGEVRQFTATSANPRAHRRELSAALGEFGRAVLERAPEALVCWGARTGADQPYVQWVVMIAARRLLQRDEQHALTRLRWVDLAWDWRPVLLPPARSWRLPDVVTGLGVAPLPEMDGYVAGQIYDDFLRGQGTPDWPALLAGRADDLRALAAVFRLGTRALGE